jgi:hypothetical protein
MKKNVGSTDKIVRLVLAAIIAALYTLGYVSDTLGIVLLIIAVIFAATSFINFCPIYKIFGTNTCKVN